MSAADMRAGWHQATPLSQSHKLFNLVTTCSRLFVITLVLCNQKTLQSDQTMLPAAGVAGNRSHCRAGPGDPRKPQALWLNTESGCGNGQRRAIILATRSCW